MKISCIPICLLDDISRRKIKPEKWYEMAARLGLDGIEMYHGYLDRWDEKHLRETARRVSDLGLAVSMFTGYDDLANPAPEQWRKAVDTVKRNVDAAVIFGAKIVRVVAGSWPKNVLRDETLDHVAHRLRQCLDYAKERQVALALEDHPEIGTDICDFVGLIMRVGRDDLKVNLDTSNPMVSGHDATDLARAVGNRVVHVHASDRNAKLEHVVLGQGAVDFDVIFHILKCEAKYDGWLSAETGGEPTEAGIRASLEFLRKTWDEA
jgi:sugar phosphate isomerase/epimerase